MVTIQKKKYFNKRSYYWFSWPNDVIEHLDSDVKGRTLILRCVGWGRTLPLTAGLFVSPPSPITEMNDGVSESKCISEAIYSRNKLMKGTRWVTEGRKETRPFYKIIVFKLF